MKKKEQQYTNYVSRKRQMMMGKQFVPGQRIPVGLLPSDKLRQLAEHNKIIDVGHSFMPRMVEDGHVSE